MVKSAVIERCRAETLDDLLRLRRLLWPDDAYAGKPPTWLNSDDGNGLAFIARDRTGEAIGFAEATLRHDPVNGCDTSPVLFLEGIYVLPAHRRNGVAKAMCEAVEAWGRALGCSEFASDALLHNVAGHAFHAAAGFEERERVVAFRKLL
jgi:aminoglycoside 6'-N-acetyltransferase I